MTESTSSTNAQIEGRFSAYSLLGAAGFTLSLSLMLIGVYSTVLSTELTSHAAYIAALRSLALLTMALTYLIVYRFVPKRNSLVRSNKAKAAFFAIQIALPVLCLIEQVSELTVPVAAVGISWALWGIATGYFTCSWMDAFSNVDEEIVSPVTFAAFVGASVLLVFIASASRPLCTGFYLTIALLAFLILLKAKGDAAESCDTESRNEKWLRENVKFRKEGSYVMFVDGMLIANIAAFAVAKIARLGLTPALVGIALLGTALLFEAIRRKNPRLLSLKHSQIFFLPVIVCGLTLMTFTTGIPQIVISIILLAVLFVFEVANTATLAVRSNAQTVSPCFCFAKGRMFSTLGQAVGWIIGAFLASSEVRYLPVLFVVFVFMVCVYVSLQALKDSEEVAPDASQQLPEESEITVLPDTIETKRSFKDKCASIAQAYDLTPREGEILSFLARGRNAKYIADKFFVSERTVKTHIYHIYQKMELHSQQELINIVDEERMPER